MQNPESRSEKENDKGRPRLLSRFWILHSRLSLRAFAVNVLSMPRRSRQLRGFRVLIGFAFGAAPREATLFLVCGVVMALSGPAVAWGSKLLVDAALARDPRGAVFAVALLAVAAGVGLLNALYYLDFLFSVA